MKKLTTKPKRPTKLKAAGASSRRLAPGDGNPPRPKRPAKASIKTPPTVAPIQNRLSRIPPDVITALERACASGKWLFAVWRVDDGTISMDRTASNYPAADIDLSIRLLAENVQELKRSG